MQSFYKRVLAAVDLERSSNAVLVTGFRLVQEHAATLRAMAAVRPQLLSAKGFFDAELVDRDELLQEARDAMRVRIAACGADSILADVLLGEPAEKIAEVAKIRESDLVVIGARARSGSEHFFGTTATEVLRLARGIDVYACHRADPENPLDRVVLAIDGTAMSQDVLSDSARFLSSSKYPEPCEVLVVCIVPADFSRRAEAVVQRCQTYLQQSEWASLNLRVEVGEVADGLDTVIREWDADLLVIGSGENLGLGWAIGSTTNSVLHEVSCDVLVVRP